MSEIEKILIDQKAIKAKVKELAKRISKEYAGKELILIGVLKGAIVFMSDLMRNLKIFFNADLRKSNTDLRRYFYLR